jgi:hypothetical protein
MTTAHGHPGDLDTGSIHCDHVCSVATAKGTPCEHNCHYQAGHSGPHFCAQHDHHHPRHGHRKQREPE